MSRLCGGRRLLLWQGSGSEVWLDDLEVREQLLCLLVLDAWVHNHIITGNPVDWCGDLVLVSGLQRIHNSQDLSSVAAGRGGVLEDSTDGFLRVDDKNRSDSEGYALGVDVGSILVIDHVVPQSNLSLLVTDDWEA